MKLTMKSSASTPFDSRRSYETCLSMLLVLMSCCSMISSSSLPVWNGLPLQDHHSELESLSGLLTARSTSEIKTLVNAKRIINDLSSSPSCTYLPTARLLQQCKLIRPNTQDRAADQQKANAQATYGISMALCEARQAQIPSPATCTAFEILLERQPPETSMEIVREADIESCMNALFETASWTSYVTYRAQSSDLCDSSRADYQREELLETFRSATNIIPEVLEALQDQQREAYVAMAGVRDMSAEVAQSQQDVLAWNREQLRESKEHLRQMFDHIKTYMQVMKDSGKSWQDDLRQGMEYTSKDLTSMRDKAAGMQVNFAELYGSAAEAVSGMTHDFETSVELMRRQINLLAENLFNVNVDEHIRGIQHAMDISYAVASDFAVVQSQQAKVGLEQLDASNHLLQVIKDSNGQFRHIKETLELIPDSWIDTLRYVQSSAMQVQDEVRYAVVFVVPSTLLLLFGRVRWSAIILLSYLFVRSSLSVARSTRFSYSNLPVTIGDIKHIGICLVAAITAGGTVATLGSFLLSLFLRREKMSKVTDAEEAKTRLFEKGSNAIAIATLARQDPSKTETPGRFTRASTAPP